MTQRSGKKVGVEPRGSDRSAPRARYDVAIVGGGPAGCVTALSFAKKRGARVLVLEANPNSSRRLAGEWIHPPAVDILKDLGVEPKPSQPFNGGRGFVVFPEDGSRPIVLPYKAGTFALSFEHANFVGTLRAHCEDSALVDYLPYARATELGDHRLSYQVESGGTHSVEADLIVGACGRMSVAHTALGIQRGAGTYSRMAGLLLKNVEMPFEGYGHVCLGGLGPILMYRIDAENVRLQIDVPLSLRLRRDRQAVLYEAYVAAIPEQLRPAFRDALRSGQMTWATNQTRPRLEFGREGLALVGDAVGYHHPLTALGMTLGFQDATTLVSAKSFDNYRRTRILKSRVPEMLAVALYEIFADTSDEVVEIRRAIYDLWREDSVERFRTMRFLGCQDTNPIAFGSSFYKAVLLAGKSLVRRGMETGRWDHVRDVTADLAERSRWLLAGALHLRPPSPPEPLAERAQQGDETMGLAEERYGAALKASSSKADVVELPFDPERAGLSRPSPALALERAARALIAIQAEDGSWEGEVVWSPMLAAQYVLSCHLLERPIDPARKRRFLLHFERTRTHTATNRVWGLSEWSEPSLFVTTLVYVAARLLGAEPTGALLGDAHRFLRAEGGVAAIPSWGKFWLAMMNLYGWEGVNPVMPEIWGLPKWFPVHPSRFYCHTRAIYLGMATLYGARFTAKRTEIIDTLRAELYPSGYESVDFERARTELREADLYAPPSAPLRASYKAFTLIERLFTNGPGLGTQLGTQKRAESLETLRERIRYELRTTSHTSISPVSGLLNVLALKAGGLDEPDADKAFARLEGWIWEDDVDGARVSGARSITWDTAFAAQALAEATPHLVGPTVKAVDARRSLARADHFLETQQIRSTFPNAASFDRVDPVGGFCFAGAWHGWPVSDCTAEALTARIAWLRIATQGASGSAGAEVVVSKEDIAAAVRFILQEQNDDGGFGSYEPRRTPFSIEWLNPAEMFGDSMTEGSYVECTASCLAALVDARPLLDDASGVDRAIERATRRLRNAQYPNGAWPGVWGVRLIYGTLFGIRGLMAAGARATDPQIRKACAWLKSHQRPDGSWGEAHVAEPSDVYHEDAEGQVTQTAWALSALIEARDPDWDAIERAARFLASAQLGSGEWPRQEPMGVFFHTALLDYTLYKSYFPLLALSQYETRRRRRIGLYDDDAAEPTAAE